MTTETPRPADIKTRSFARHFPTVARLLMGVLLLVFGLNGFLNFMPPPPQDLPAAAVAFNMGMMKTGYMFPLIFGTQIVTGALLVVNRFVPLALALLAPFLVNSVAFHVFLALSGLSVALCFVAAELYLAWAYRKAFFPMLAMRVAPNAQ